MRFMILVKADKNSEAGVMPSTEMLTEMNEFTEQLVNDEVLANEPVRAYETTKDEAAAMGAIAFFGEFFKSRQQ